MPGVRLRERRGPFRGFAAGEDGGGLFACQRVRIERQLDREFAIELHDPGLGHVRAPPGSVEALQLGRVAVVEREGVRRDHVVVYSPSETPACRRGSTQSARGKWHVYPFGYFSR